MTADPTHPVDCLNCGTRVDGRFCSDCGQSASTGRLLTRDTFFDALAHVFQLDSQILRTLVGLTRSPGRVCAEYVEGRRIRYVAPLKYFLVAITLVILVNLATGFDPLEIAPAPGAEQAREVQREVASFALKHLDLAVLLALPFFIGVVRLMFRRAGHTYAEVSVFVLFVLGHSLLLGLVFVPFRSAFPALALPGKLLLQTGLFSWASVKFFRVSVVSSVLRNLLLVAVYLFLMMLSILLLTLPKTLALVGG